MIKLQDFLKQKDLQQGYQKVDPKFSNALELVGDFSWGFKTRNTKDSESFTNNIDLKNIDLKVKKGLL